MRDDEQPDEAKDEDYDSNFRFFSQFTKPLVLELPSSEDRALAAAWVQKLEVEPTTDEEKRLRVDYLKLLLFVMQRGRLVGMFKKEPPTEPLEPFPQGFGLTEMGNFLLEQAELQGSGDSSGKAVSYSVEISNDLREFVAAQEIPDFGVQVYYAWSVDDPVHKWRSFDEKKFPKYLREKIRKLKAVSSEDDTNVQSSLPDKEKDCFLRRSCESSLIYEKCKPKVKSPEEIQKFLERRFSPRGSCLRERSSEEDRNWAIRARDLCSSGKGYPDSFSKNVTPCQSIASAQEFGGEVTDRERYEDVSGGMRRSCKGSRRTESPGRSRSGLRKHLECCGRPEGEISKRMQSYDNEGENGSEHINERARMAGRTSGRMPNDRKMYSDGDRCGAESVPIEKTSCKPSKEHQVNDELSQLNTRKPKYTLKGNMSVYQDPGAEGSCYQDIPRNKKCSRPDHKKNCICLPEEKHCCNKSSCPCPCPKTGTPQRTVSYKRNQKITSEKILPKSGASWSETAPPRKPCKAADERLKPCSKKPTSEYCNPDASQEDRRKQELGNLTRLCREREKAITEPCQQEMPPQYQLQSFPTRRNMNQRQERSLPLPNRFDPCDVDSRRKYQSMEDGVLKKSFCFTDKERGFPDQPTTHDFSKSCHEKHHLDGTYNRSQDPCSKLRASPARGDGMYAVSFEGSQFCNPHDIGLPGPTVSSRPPGPSGTPSPPCPPCPSGPSGPPCPPGMPYRTGATDQPCPPGMPYRTGATDQPCPPGMPYRTGATDQPCPPGMPYRTGATDQPCPPCPPGTPHPLGPSGPPGPQDYECGTYPEKRTPNEQSVHGSPGLNQSQEHYTQPIKPYRHYCACGMANFKGMIPIMKTTPAPREFVDELTSSDENLGDDDGCYQAGHVSNDGCPDDVSSSENVGGQTFIAGSKDKTNHCYPLPVIDSNNYLHPHWQPAQKGTTYAKYPNKTRSQDYECQNMEENMPHRPFATSTPEEAQADTQIYPCFGSPMNARSNTNPSRQQVPYRELDVYEDRRKMPPCKKSPQQKKNAPKNSCAKFTQEETCGETSGLQEHLFVTLKDDN